MQPSLQIQGRSWSCEQLKQIGQWIAEHGNWSRYRLSRQLCVHWQWVRPNGQLAEMAARSVLNKLDQRGLIELPALRRVSPNRMKHRRLKCEAVDSSPLEGELPALGPLNLLEVSQDPHRRALFETLLATEHYLG